MLTDNNVVRTSFTDDDDSPLGAGSRLVQPQPVNEQLTAADVDGSSTNDTDSPYINTAFEGSNSNITAESDTQTAVVNNSLVELPGATVDVVEVINQPLRLSNVVNFNVIKIKGGNFSWQEQTTHLFEVAPAPSADSSTDSVLGGVTVCIQNRDSDNLIESFPSIVVSGSGSSADLGNSVTESQDITARGSLRLRDINLDIPKVRIRLDYISICSLSQAYCS